MILCHKCSGLLAAGKDENKEGLYSCLCISSYVRDWQIPITREKAIIEQSNSGRQSKPLVSN